MHQLVDSLSVNPGTWGKDNKPLPQLLPPENDSLILASECSLNMENKSRRDPGPKGNQDQAV